MTRTRTAAIALAVATALAACSHGGDATPTAPTDVASQALPPCKAMFTPGRPTDQVMAEYDDGACTDATGAPYLTMVVSMDCPDGTTLYYVEGYGHGTTGQPWQPPNGQGALAATTC